MADRPSPGGGQRTRPSSSSSTITSSRSSTQVMGLLMLLISGGILLCFTGLTVTITILGLIFVTPLILLTSPIWIPIGTLLFITVAGFLCLCGFGVVMFLGLSWIYKNYFGVGWTQSSGSGPRVGSSGGDDDNGSGSGSGRRRRRSRVVGESNEMSFIARDQGGGYFQTKVKKDAGPSA